MAVIIFILVWSITFIIYWVKHPASMMGILEFIIPILILPIICSAYGEVNYEGRRMIRVGIVLMLFGKLEIWC